MGICPMFVDKDQGRNMQHAVTFTRLCDEDTNGL